MTAHAQGFYEQPLCYIAEVQQMQHTFPKARIEMLLRTGKRYTVKAITQEWSDAVRVITEPADLPVLVRKFAILTVTVELDRRGP